MSFEGPALPPVKEPEETYTWTILGPPVAKGRPRAAVVWTYDPAKREKVPQARLHTPAKTEQWERDAARTFRADAPRVLHGRLDVLKSGPLKIEVDAHFPRPQSLIWKRRPMPIEWHEKRPDGDNVLKAVCDAFEQSGLIRADSQFAEKRVRKFIARGDGKARVVVRVEKLAPASSRMQLLHVDQDRLVTEEVPFELCRCPAARLEHVHGHEGAIYELSPQQWRASA